MNTESEKRKGLPWWLRWQRICLQCRRPRFDPWVRKIPLGKEMATHSSTLAWKIPWTEEPGRLQSIGAQESDTTVRLTFFLFFGFYSHIGRYRILNRVPCTLGDSSYSLFIPSTPTFPLVILSLFSTSVSLFLFFVNIFIYTIFLDSTYK